MKPKDQFHLLSHPPLTRQPGVTRRHVSRGLTCGETRYSAATILVSIVCDVCYDHCAPNDQSIIASFTLLSTHHHHHHHHHPSPGRHRDGCIASYRLSWPRVNAGLSSFLRLPGQLLVLTSAANRFIGSTTGCTITGIDPTVSQREIGSTTQLS